MTRDYKNVRRYQDRPLPGWVWMLAGLTMGLTVALMVYLNQPRLSPAGARAISTAPNPALDANTSQRQKPTPTPAERRFDFYTLLPELEVVIPAHQTRPAPARGSGDPPSPAQAATGPYILQAGSFQRAEEADTLKANLALLGVEAYIQKVTVDNNTWHRVRVGPYTDVTQLNRVRDQLTRHHIDTVTLKERL